MIIKKVICLNILQDKQENLENVAAFFLPDE